MISHVFPNMYLLGDFFVFFSGNGPQWVGDWQIAQSSGIHAACSAMDDVVARSVREDGCMGREMKMDQQKKWDQRNGAREMGKKEMNGRKMENGVDKKWR